MPMTRIAADAALLRMVGDTLIKVGRDGTTADGTNVDLSLGLGLSLMAMGRPVVDVMAVSDAELSGITGLDQKRLLHVARVEVLENILSNWTKTNATAGSDNRQDMAVLRNSIEITVARLRRQIEKDFGIGLGSLTPGVFDLGFAETTDVGTGRPR